MLIYRCPHCMEDLWGSGEGPCPFCGFDQDAVPQPDGALSRNTILYGKYLVGDVLEQNDLERIYLGFDLSLEIKVIIREYAPAGRQEDSGPDVRKAQEDYLGKARELAKSRPDDQTAQVRETFLANGTAYVVLDYLESPARKEETPADSPAPARKPRKLPKWTIPVCAAAVLLLAVGLYQVIPMDASDKEIVVNGETVGVYSGQVVAGRPSGEGTMSYANGDVYQGGWKAGQREGQGILTYAGENENGLVMYDGEWKNDQRAGQGVLTWANGDVYEGEWANNLRNGQGTITYAEDDQVERVSYTGGWVDDQRSGTGTMTWQNGAVYEGEWANDRREGQGKHTFSNGDVYEGQWAGGERNGQGTITYAEDDEVERVSYTGGWVDDQRSGTGTMTWQNGAVYEGEWAEGVREGRGKHTYSGGDVYEGQWADDKPNGQGTRTYAQGEGNVNGLDQYVGQWVDGEREGQGTLTWINGNRYEGEWANDRREGQGTMYYSDGTQRTGTWKAGALVR